MVDPAVVTVQDIQIPRIGLGTWQLRGRDATAAVSDALEIGYRSASAFPLRMRESTLGAMTVFRRSGVPLNPDQLVLGKALADVAAIGLLQQRAERARRCIRAGDTLAAAALASGFADQSHMTRVFARQCGFTPGAWQRAATAGRLQ